MRLPEAVQMMACNGFLSGTYIFCWFTYCK